MTIRVIRSLNAHLVNWLEVFHKVIRCDLCEKVVYASQLYGKYYIVRLTTDSRKVKRQHLLRFLLSPRRPCGHPFCLSCLRSNLATLSSTSPLFSHNGTGLMVSSSTHRISFSG